MKDMLANLFGFIYSLSMGDYFFFIGTFLLIVLFIYVIYLIKCSELEAEGKDPGELDLKALTKQIEAEYKPGTIELTGYEAEQEHSAIISYEELVQNKDKLGIDYDDEYTFDVPDLEVKKINLTTEANPNMISPKLEVKLMSYDKEEAFLEALKELQNNLIN